MTLLEKKQLYAKLFRLTQTIDDISMTLDADITKTEILDRISLILPGMVATLILLVRQMEPEIAYDTEQHRMAEEFRRLYDAEQTRKPHLKPPPADEDDDDDDNISDYPEANFL